MRRHTRTVRSISPAGTAATQCEYSTRSTGITSLLRYPPMTNHEDMENDSERRNAMTLRYYEIVDNAGMREQAERYSILVTLLSKLVLALLFASLFVAVSYLP